MLTLIADLCLLLLNLKISISKSDWSFIWKYKRPYARKSQNDATTILKAQLRDFSLKVLQMNWKVPGSNPLGTQSSIGVNLVTRSPVANNFSG